MIFQWYALLLSPVGSSIKQGTTNSICGYDTVARQSRYRRESKNPVKWTKQRQTNYEFRGCLAHAVVTWNLASEQVERVIGHLEHFRDCTAAPVIDQYISKLSLSLEQKDYNRLDSAVAETGHPEEQCLGERPAYGVRELLELPLATRTCVDKPGDTRGHVR